MMCFHVGGTINFTNKSLPVSAYSYIFVEFRGIVSCSQYRSILPWAT